MNIPILDGVNLMVFFPGGWDKAWRGRYLIESMASQLKGSTILCVENPIDLFVALIKHPLEWMANVKCGRRATRARDNLLIFRPWIFCNANLATAHVLRKLNAYWMRKQLHRVFQETAFQAKPLIIWITDPIQKDYLEIMPAALKVYDCYDEFVVETSSFFRRKRDLHRRERIILQKVDITFVVSEFLYKNKKIPGKNIYLVPNGVDANHFESAGCHDTIIPDDLRGMPGPIVGFIGNISDRIDWSLLNFLAQRNPDWSLVMIGGQDYHSVDRHSIKMTKQNKNIHMLGHRPYLELPGYLKAFGVGIIPYCNNDPLNLNCSPLKVYEYLAAGKPVVSTKLPGLASFGSFIGIAETKEEFEKYVKEALSDNFNLQLERIEFARTHSWDSRAKKILGLLEEALTLSFKNARSSQPDNTSAIHADEREVWKNSLTR